MKIVLQRVLSAKVKFGNEKREIGYGIAIFVGIGTSDTEEIIFPLVKKILNLRIFEDEEKKMNFSILDVKGDILVVSEFTLYGDCFSGNRPDFGLAKEPKEAEILYNKFVEELKNSGLKVMTGKFRSYMQVEIVNDGPVTFILEK